MENNVVNEISKESKNEDNRLYTYDNLYKLVDRMRSDLNEVDIILLFAFNGTGKTRLSMDFKEKGKFLNKKNVNSQSIGDTLYFNAYTEDLFNWDNDFEGDTDKKLLLNPDTKFFNGLQQLAIEKKINPYLERYAEFDFKVKYDKWYITFSKNITNNYIDKKNGETISRTKTIENIKVSRGEETIFIWCFFLAICELAIDDAEGYQWVKYIYIDDPISSLDDNNAIAVAVDLARLIRRAKGKIKCVISSHHALFFNVMCNELRTETHKKFFLHKVDSELYNLQSTDDTPFFHHVAVLSELKKAKESGELYTYHFNAFRAILEKTAAFFGYKDYTQCIDEFEDKTLYLRAINLLSHGKYSILEPRRMGDDTKDLFNRAFDNFMSKYAFALPDIFQETQKSIQQKKVSSKT